jgi:hypothetical protein
MEKADGSNVAGVPDPEVCAGPQRRQFTDQYKLGILREADGCTKPGELGSLLRREGLYSSNLTTWRREREKGALGAKAQKRGRKARTEEQLRAEIKQVRREKDQVVARLRKAETVIEVQKKVSDLLGDWLPSPSQDERAS